MKLFILKILISILLLNLNIYAQNSDKEIQIFSRLSYQGGFLHTTRKCVGNEPSESVFYFNIDDANGGTAKSFSSIYSPEERTNAPDRIFSSSISLINSDGKYRAKLLYSICKLVDSDTRYFYDIKHGLREFDINFDVKYEIPIAELEGQKYIIYFSKDSPDKNIEFEGIESWYFKEINNNIYINEKCNSKIQLEYLRTNTNFTEIYTLDSFFPIQKAKEFYNTLKKQKTKLKSKVFFGELEIPFEILNESEKNKIPNYDRIKKNFIANLKVIAVPVGIENGSPEFEIYISYGRFKGLYYCEWDTIKKRIRIDPGEKVKIELPVKDWSMRAFNPLTKLNINWYEAYHKHVKEFIILSIESSD